MYANNETGVIFPIHKIGDIVKAKGIPFHVDAVQVAGRLALKVKDSPVDLLTISGHKFHGPKGIGALYVRRGVAFPPLIIGGHQEKNRRGGTENVAGIVGMGEAAALMQQNLARESEAIRKLRDQLEEELLQSCPDCRINGRGSDRLPNTSNVSFRYLEGEAVLVLLDQFGICASTGSACTAGSSEPSHVLRAMGVAPDWLQGAVRFSLSRFNTAEEVRYVNEKVPLIVQRLQGLSALGKLADQQRAQQNKQGAGTGIG
jgi:cysteine desulfurase